LRCWIFCSLSVFMDSGAPPLRYTLLEAIDLIVEWRGCTHVEALVALTRALDASEVRGSERPIGGERRWINPLRYQDVVFTWYDRPRLIGQDRPDFYDKRLSDYEWLHYIAKPAFPDLLIEGADFRVKFCPVPEPPPPSEPPAPVPTSPATGRKGVRGPTTRKEVKTALRALRPDGKTTADTYKSLVDLLRSHRVKTSVSTIQRALREIAEEAGQSGQISI
jgi:hypothetical protein